MIGLFWRGKNKLAARKFGGEMGKMLEFLIGDNINASSEAKFKKQNM